MRLRKIVEHFALFSGLDLTTAMEYMPLCRWAMETVNKSIRPGAQIEGNEERLELVAGAMVYHQYALSGDNGKSVTVGDMKVEASAGDVDRAREIWQEMWSSASDLLYHPAGDVWLCS